MTDADLIAYYGGPAALARALRLKGRHPVQRVVNWRTRGIPAAVKLARLDLFGPDAVARLARERTPEAA